MPNSRIFVSCCSKHAVDGCSYKHVYDSDPEAAYASGGEEEEGEMFDSDEDVIMEEQYEDEEEEDDDFGMPKTPQELVSCCCRVILV